MTTDKLMNDFLTHAAQHLLNNREKFLSKLENGDVSAIKMVFDFINKTASKSKQKSNQAPPKNIKIEDMKYEQAFETIKNALEETINPNNQE